MKHHVTHMQGAAEDELTGQTEVPLVQCLLLSRCIVHDCPLRGSFSYHRLWDIQANTTTKGKESLGSHPRTAMTTQK